MGCSVKVHIHISFDQSDHVNKRYGGLFYTHFWHTGPITSEIMNPPQNSQTHSQDFQPDTSKVKSKSDIYIGKLRESATL